MGGKKRVSKASELAPHENPLVRNATLLEMYRKMVEARVLEEQVRKKRRLSSGGREACLVGVLQGLEAGDVVLGAGVDGVVEHLLGGRLAGWSKGKKATDGATLLPYVAGDEARLLAGVGAGLVLKKVEKKKAVVVYVGSEEARKGVWLQVLKLSGELDLPILFVTVAAANGSSRVCEWARRSGVPGIPVDANDVVAMYRVAQESMGRIRGEGGPVVMECIRYRLKGKKLGAEMDGVGQLREFLLGRQICSAAWMDGVVTRFLARLTKA